MPIDICASLKQEPYFRIISEPTITSALPVAQGGIDAKIGAKNIETKNASPVVIAVKPVWPPSDGNINI